MQPSDQGYNKCEISEEDPGSRKPYSKTETIHELDLETRAGSLNIKDPLNPFDLQPEG